MPTTFIKKENVLSIAYGASSNKLMQIIYLVDDLSVGTGKGLTIDYFNSTNFQNKIISTTDNLNYDLGSGSSTGNVQAVNTKNNCQLKKKCYI